MRGWFWEGGGGGWRIIGCVEGGAGGRGRGRVSGCLCLWLWCGGAEAQGARGVEIRRGSLPIDRLRTSISKV